MRKAMLAMAAALAVSLGAGLIAPLGALSAKAEADTGPEKDYIEVVEELEWVPEKTEAAGFGELHKNADYGGKPLVVNEKTYDRNSLGTHLAPPNDGNPERDIVYDISAYSKDYPYFYCLVGQPDDGNNIIEYTILVSDEGGAEKAVDKTMWRHRADNNDDTQPAIPMRAYVKNAKYLILRTKCLHTSYSDGTCAFLDVRLLKEETGNAVHAGRLLNRADESMVSKTGYGWAPPSGGANLLDNQVFFDCNIDGTSFDALETPTGGDPCDDIYRDSDQVGYKEYLSLHMKQITGSELMPDAETPYPDGASYDLYRENYMSDTSKYVYIKWNIENMGFTYFSALGYDGWGWGFHADIWIDGEEVSQSGYIRSVATNGALSGDTRSAPQEFGCAIPENAKIFEIRVIADTWYGNGEIRIIEPTFFRSGADKLSHYPSTQQAASIFPYETVRGRMWDGKPTAYRDCENDNAEVTVSDGFFFVAGGEKEDATSYTFDLTGVTGNTLVANLGRALYYPDQPGAAPVVLHYEAQDEEGKVTSSGETEGVDWTNSGLEVTIPLGKNAKTLTVWVTSANTSFSETVLANGRFVTKRSVSYSDGTTTKVELYDDGATIVEPQAPTKTGYNFVEWRKKGEETKFDFANAKATEDIELEAVWSAQEYNITYKRQLGEGSETDLATGSYPAKHTYGTVTALPASAADVEGYTFNGWYVNGSKVTELAADGYTANVTVTAKYDIIVLNVEFYNGDSKITDKDVDYGSTVVVSDVNVPAKTGYTFAGWQTKSGDVYEDFSPSTQVKSNLKLYAKWSPESYTITYRQQLGGNTATDVSGYAPTTHVYGTATALPEARAVAGYTFEGWYVDGTKVTELAADGYIGDITVTARYSVATVNVTFVTGEGEEETLQYDVGSTVGEKVPEREGYTFEGWYLDEDCTQSYDTGSAIESDLTLYAKWKSESKGGCGGVISVTAGVSGALIIAGVCAVALIRKKKQEK